MVRKIRKRDGRITRAIVKKGSTLFFRKRGQVYF